MRELVDRIKRLALVSRFIRVFKSEDIRMHGNQPTARMHAKPKSILIIGDTKDFLNRVEKGEIGQEI